MRQNPNIPILVIVLFCFLDLATCEFQEPPSLLMNANETKNYTQYDFIVPVLYPYCRLTAIACVALVREDLANLLPANKTFLPLMYNICGIDSGPVMLAIHEVIKNFPDFQILVIASDYPAMTQSILRQFNIVEVSPLSTAVDLGDRHRFSTFIQLDQTQTSQALPLAVLFSHMEWKIIGVMYHSRFRPAIDAIIKSSAKVGVSVLVSDSYDTGSESFRNFTGVLIRAQIENFKKLNVRIILLGIDFEDTDMILSEFYELGMLGPPYLYIGINEWLQTSNALRSEVYGKLLKGTMGVTTLPLQDDPLYAAFTHRWQQKYARDPASMSYQPLPKPISAFGYDSIVLSVLTLSRFARAMEVCSRNNDSSSQQENSNLLLDDYDIVNGQSVCEMVKEHGRTSALYAMFTNMTYDGASGSVHLNLIGERQNQFRFINVQESANGSMILRNVGSWDLQNSTLMHLDVQDIIFPDGTHNPPPDRPHRIIRVRQPDKAALICLSALIVLLFVLAMLSAILTIYHRNNDIFNIYPVTYVLCICIGSCVAMVGASALVFRSYTANSQAVCGVLISFLMVGFTLQVSATCVYIFQKFMTKGRLMKIRFLPGNRIGSQIMVLLLLFDVLIIFLCGITTHFNPVQVHQSILGRSKLTEIQEVTLTCFYRENYPMLLVAVVLKGGILILSCILCLRMHTTKQPFTFSNPNLTSICTFLSALVITSTFPIFIALQNHETARILVLALAVISVTAIQLLSSVGPPFLFIFGSSDGIYLLFIPEGDDEVLFRITAEGKILQCSATWQQDLGWTLKSTYGQNIENYIQEEDKPVFNRMLEEANRIRIETRSGRAADDSLPEEDKQKVIHTREGDPCKVVVAEGSIRFIIESKGSRILRQTNNLHEQKSNNSARKEEEANVAAIQSRWFHVKLFLSTDPRQLFGSARDIHACKMEALVMKERENAALASSKAKALFLATMSHEIRTPMNGIMAMAHFLEYTPLTAEQHECVDTISTCSSHLLTVINDILDLSRVESGRMKLEFNSFDLYKVIEDAISLSYIPTTHRKLSVAYKVDQTVPRIVWGDAVRFRQILVNLCSNALKFSKSEGEVLVDVQLVPNEQLIQDNSTVATKVKSPRNLDLNANEQVVNDEERSSKRLRRQSSVSCSVSTGNLSTPPNIVLPSTRRSSIDSTTPLPLSRQNTATSTLNSLSDNPTVKQDSAQGYSNNSSTAGDYLPIRLLISVRDQGIGIPPGKMNELFSPFSQLDTSTTRLYGGSGLGLAICKRLCTLMDGEIWARSEGESLGSTFSFTIVLQKQVKHTAFDPIRPVDDVEKLKIGIGEDLPMSALIVDCHTFALQYLSDMLSQWGLAVDICGEADQLVKWYHSARKRDEECHKEDKEEMKQSTANINSWCPIHKYPIIASSEQPPYLPDKQWDVLMLERGDAEAIESTDPLHFYSEQLGREFRERNPQSLIILMCVGEDLSLPATKSLSSIRPTVQEENRYNFADMIIRKPIRLTFLLAELKKRYDRLKQGDGFLWSAQRATIESKETARLIVSANAPSAMLEKSRSNLWDSRRGSTSPEVNHTQTKSFQRLAHPAVEWDTSGLQHELLPMHILVCDDNIINQKVAIRLLKRIGYSGDEVVEVANDGWKAIDAFFLAILKNNPYDLILMDWRMPICDGLEASRRIRTYQKRIEENGEDASLVREEFLNDNFFKHSPISGEKLGSSLASSSRSATSPLPNRVITKSQMQQRRSSEGSQDGLGEYHSTTVTKLSTITSSNPEHEMNGEDAWEYPVILAMTANVGLSDRNLCHEAGMQSVITKPIDIEAFQQEITHWAVLVNARKKQNEAKKESGCT